MRTAAVRLLTITLIVLFCGWISADAANANDAPSAEQEADPVYLPLMGNYRASQPLAAGYSHTCAIVAGGQVRCWGDNGSGQLGNGSQKESITPVFVRGLYGVSAIASGWYHTCAIGPGRGVLCWGEGYGSVPVRIAEVEEATRLSAGLGFACAIVAEGRVRCWGEASPIKGEVPNVIGATALSSGFGETCALISDGTLRCWPFGAEKVIEFPGVTDAESVAVGGWFRYKSGLFQICVVTAAHIVECWYGSRGSMFEPPAEPIPPVPVPGTEGAMTVTAGRAGSGHLCALTRQHRVFCWYDNSYAQYGNGERTAYPGVWLAEGVDTAAFVDAGAEHVCAMLTNGKVMCWGDNAGGQLGADAVNEAIVPVHDTHSFGVVLTAAGYTHSCASVVNGQVYCWGSDWEHALGDGLDRGSAGARYKPLAVVNMGGVTALAAGRIATCAIRPPYGAYCWGSGLMNGGDYSTLVPRPIAGMSSATGVAVGGFHACAVTGAREAWCWGAGDAGQLGTGQTGSAVDPVRVIGLTQVGIVAAGPYHSCAARRDGNTFCWGDNAYGQVGDGTRESRLSPVPVPGVGDARGLALGGGLDSGHTCALADSGIVLCWGKNHRGQLGDGSAEDRLSPVQVAGINDANMVAAGNNHTCALVSDGRVKCWGSNERGQLGNGAGGAEDDLSRVPVEVAGIRGAYAIMAGGDHSCALVQGTLYCWGENHDGQLGVNPGWIPVLVPGLGR